MSKRVILIRHAKSSWSHQGLSDFERPLNGRGRENAPYMGQKLHSHGFQIDQIYSSPSKRTSQTIKRITKEIDFEYSEVEFENSMYHGGTDDLLDVIHGVDDKHQCIALVTHNPGITYLANYLQKDTYIANVPTCGIVSISFSMDTWLSISESNGSLEFFDYPKKDL
ncbi:MAG: histidine phosphatase family protein [Flavobacteriales bacterium]|nr:histidine phosphatase family protein [Flavobacteriales bacterium]